MERLANLPRLVPVQKSFESRSHPLSLPPSLPPSLDL